MGPMLARPGADVATIAERFEDLGIGLTDASLVAPADRLETRDVARSMSATSVPCGRPLAKREVGRTRPHEAEQRVGQRAGHPDKCSASNGRPESVAVPTAQISVAEMAATENKLDDWPRAGAATGVQALPSQWTVYGCW